MKYDLGQEPDNGPCCAPAGPSDDKKKVYYPSLYFSSGTKMDIPDEGTAIITFRKIESGENTRDPDDPKYRCEIEVHSIEIMGGAKKKSEDYGGDMRLSMREAARKMMQKKTEVVEEE